jgi:hypothetical protein
VRFGKKYSPAGRMASIIFNQKKQKLASLWRFWLAECQQLNRCESKAAIGVLLCFYWLFSNPFGLPARVVSNREGWP